MFMHGQWRVFYAPEGGDGGAGGGGGTGGGGGAGGGTGGVGGGGATGGAAGAGAAVSWTEGFDSDTLGYVQNKGWKAPIDLVSSYRNLEKLHGVPPDQIIKLPKDETDADGWKSVWQKLGAPDSPDKYEIPMPEAGGDEGFAKWARETFHGMNMPAGMARKLVESYNQYAASINENATKEYAAKVAADTEALKKKWGADYDGNIDLAKRAAAELGLDGPKVEALEKAMGFAGLMEFVHGLGTKLGTSDTFVGGEGKGGGGGAPNTQAAALQKIRDLKADKGWATRYAQGDADAKAEMRRLMQIAYPGETIL